MASSTEEDFYQEIKDILMVEYGYTEEYIAIFKGDVYDCYYQGKSISQTIAEVY